MSLNFDITADNSSFVNSLHQITAGVQDASRQIEESGGNIDNVINQIKNGLITLGVATSIKGFVSQIANVRGEYQQLEVAFETMLGSKEKSDELMSQMIRTAAITPFGINDVTNGAKSLLAYGVAAEDVNDTLIRLGDIAAGLSIPLNDLTYLYGTTITQGRMFTQDLRQFQGRGIPIAKELSKQFGVAENKVGDLVTAGKVTSKEFIAAIKSMTDEGSTFGGLMNKQSKTISGQISNIEDAIEQMFNEIGKSTEGIISGTLSATSTIVENWETVLAIVGDVAAAYGAQKAWLALDAGFEKAKTNFGYDTEISQLTELLGLKEQLKQTELEQAVSSGQLSKEKADHVVSLREEAEAYIESLKAAEEKAAQADQAAQANLAIAEQEHATAEEMVEDAKEKWEAAYDSADAFAEEIAAQELETAKAIEGEAADNLATASKEAKAASSAHVAAQQSLETASTKVNTAQQASNTAATNILTIAKHRLAEAIARVNAMMNANKISIIIGLVIAAGYAIHKLLTYQTEYEKSLDRLEDAHDKSEKSIISEGVEIDKLFNKLKKAKEGTEEWNEAKDAIWSKYGEYLKSLGDETTALNDVAAAYTLVKTEAEKAARARAMDAYLKSEEDIYAENVSNLRQKAFEMIEKKYGEDYVNLYQQDIIDIIEGRKQGSEKFLSDMNTDRSLGRFGTFSRIILDIQKEREQLDLAYSNAEKRFGQGRTSEKKETTAQEPNLKESYDKAKKDYEDAKKIVADINADRKSHTQSEYEEAVEKLKTTKKEYEKLGGDTKEATGETAEQRAAKAADAEQKLTDLLEKQFDEREKIDTDYELSRQQNRINLMKDGEAKVLAQMELDREKELESLKRQEEQEIKAEIARQKAAFDANEDVKATTNSKYAKKTFFPEGDVDEEYIDAIKSRYEKLYDDLKAQQAKAEDDRIEEAKKSMNEYLKEFGSYQQKRLAIQQDYEKQIAEAVNAGERMRLIGQRNKALADLDYSEWMESGDLSLAFSDLSTLSADTIDQLIADMEKYRQKVVDTMDPEKLKTYEEALTSLRQTQLDNSFRAFGNSVPDYFKRRKGIGDQLQSAGENVNALQDQRTQLMAKKNQLESDKAKGQDVTEDLEEVNAALDQNQQATIAATKSFAQLQKQWDKLDSPEEKFYGVCAAVEQASALVGGLTSSMANMFAELEIDGASKFASTASAAIGSVGNIASGFAQGGIVGGAAAAATELFNWGGKLFGGKESDPHLLEDIERMTAVNEELINAIENLTDKMEKATLAEAGEIYEQQIKYIQQAMGNTRQMMQRSAAAYGSHHSSNYYVDQKMSYADWRRISTIAGKSIRSASQFWTLTSEQMDNVRTNAADLYAKIKLYADDGNNNAAQFMDEYTEYYKQLDELQDAYAEKLTATTFDSVRDSFKSLLTEMENDEEAFGESFENTLRDAVINGLMSNVFDERIREWYDSFADMMEEGNSINPQERAALQEQWEGIVSDAINQRDELYATLGLDNSSTYSQKATAGGYETMSEDTGQELNGRFTAIQDSNERIVQAVAASIQSMQEMSVATRDGNAILNSILLQHVRTNEYLDDIKAYTKDIRTFGDKLDKIASNTSNL